MDRRAARALARRVTLARRAGKAKAQLGRPIVDPSREASLLAERRAWAEALQLDGEESTSCSGPSSGSRGGHSARSPRVRSRPPATAPGGEQRRGGWVKEPSGPETRAVWGARSVAAGVPILSLESIGANAPVPAIDVGRRGRLRKIGRRRRDRSCMLRVGPARPVPQPVPPETDPMNTRAVPAARLALTLQLVAGAALAQPASPSPAPPHYTAVRAGKLIESGDRHRHHRPDHPHQGPEVRGDRSEARDPLGGRGHRPHRAHGAPRPGGRPQPPGLTYKACRSGTTTT